jgi:hypothetical protein
MLHLDYVNQANLTVQASNYQIPDQRPPDPSRNRPLPMATASSVLTTDSQSIAIGDVLRCGMITYTIIASAEKTGFHVKIDGSDGNRQTILGFATESDAETWIANDKRLTDDAALFVATPGT